MSKITLDAETAAKLMEAEPASELVGPDGKALGILVSSNLRYEVEHMIECRRAIDEANRDVTLESLRAADARGGETPHSEIIRRLEQRNEV